MKKEPLKPFSTSWQPVAHWYDDLVGKQGHFYHQEVIFPNLLRLMQLKSSDRLLDLGCGQGVLARQLPKEMGYVGLDISKELIAEAHRYSKRKEHQFIVHDITKSLPFLPNETFSLACLILSLQNIEDQEAVIRNVAPFMKDGGRLFICLNHPSFRIPRQSSWGYDEATKMQYRKLFSYMSPQKVPIVMHPGKNTKETWSFHFPLSAYTNWLQKYGFVIEVIEEWCSPKESTGGRAKAENRARKEFPLFLTIVARYQ